MRRKGTFKNDIIKSLKPHHFLYVLAFRWHSGVPRAKPSHLYSWNKCHCTYNHLPLSVPPFPFPFSSSLIYAPWACQYPSGMPTYNHWWQTSNKLKFPYTLHVSIFNEPKTLWAKTVKIQICMKSNQQWP